MVLIGFDPYIKLPPPDASSAAHASSRLSRQGSFDVHLERATRPPKAPPAPTEAPQNSDSANRQSAEKTSGHDSRHEDDKLSNAAAARSAEESADTDEDDKNADDNEVADEDQPDAVAAAAAGQSQPQATPPGADGQKSPVALIVDGASEGQPQAKKSGDEGSLAVEAPVPSAETATESDVGVAIDDAGAKADAEGTSTLASPAQGAAKQADTKVAPDAESRKSAQVAPSSESGVGQAEATKASAESPETISESPVEKSEKKPARESKQGLEINEQAGDAAPPAVKPADGGASVSLPDAAGVAGDSGKEQAAEGRPASGLSVESPSPNANASAAAPVVSAPPARPANNSLAPTHAGATTNRNSEAGEVDASRFLQRVTRAFHVAGERGGEVRLRLSPPELGSLQVEISVREGVLTARMTAENSTARSLLLDNLPDLRQRLAEQDIRIERFDVELRDQSSGGQQQTADRQTNPEAAPTKRAALREAAPVDRVGAVSGAGRHAAGQLNVVI